MGNNGVSRRGFLKTLGLAGVAMAIEPTLNKVQAATSVVEGRREIAGGATLPHRTLGTGNAAFEDAKQQRHRAGSSRNDVEYGLTK